MLLSSILILNNIFCIQACGSSPNCPKYSYKDREDCSPFIETLPDSLKLKQLVLVGTRESASHKSRLPLRTQDKNITEQLTSGVRFLDIGLRLISNRFAVYIGYYFSGFMFDSIVEEIKTFLDENPKELVMMQVKISYKPDITQNYCNTFQSYNSSLFRNNWSLEDTIGMHRGRILLATITDNSFNPCITDLKPHCQLSSEFRALSKAKSKSQIQAKMSEFFALQNASFSRKFDCYFSYLGDYSMRYLRDSALIGYAEDGATCDAPINHQVANSFWNPHCALVVIITDLPTTKLIYQINNSNFKPAKYYSYIVD